jgi:hypothetical protein
VLQVKIQCCSFLLGAVFVWVGDFSPLQQWFCVYVSVPHSRAAHSPLFACSLAFASKQQFVVFLLSSESKVNVDVW